ncbi:L-alanine-DL-glutamate epimerase-like enolase superfamily enzyme [Phyllobacterium ifriqiyense]
MIDPNEARNSKEALVKLTVRDAGHDLLWVEDPVLRQVFQIQGRKGNGTITRTV